MNTKQWWNVSHGSKLKSTKREIFLTATLFNIFSETGCLDI